MLINKEAGAICKNSIAVLLAEISAIVVISVIAVKNCEIAVNLMAPSVEAITFMSSGNPLALLSLFVPIGKQVNGI